MKVLKWLVISVLVLIAAVVAVGFFLPDTVHVERSIVLKSKPATVYTALNGFRHFNKWSPWFELDPNARITTEGPVTGVGAKQSWSSDDPNVGAGSQEIIETRPYELIRIRLVFEGFDTDNTASYLIAPEGEGSRLTWAYDSDFKGQILARYVGLLMDDVLGPDYEKGLLKFQALVESLPQDDFSDLPLEVVETRPVTVAYIAGEGAAEDIGPKLGDLYGKVMDFVKSNGAKQTDAPMAITREWSDEARYWKFEAAIAVDRADLVTTPESEVQVKQTYAGLAIKATHKGPYAAMEPTYMKLMAFKAVAGYEDNGNSWEHYVTDPGNTPEADLVTHVYWPVK
jgi:effector-binding domain-containing protein